MEPSQDVRRQAQNRPDRGCQLLKQGRFSEGWKEYEHRFAATGRSRNLPQPLWRGEPLTGRKLFLHREQGLGDEILYASCFPDLLRSCGELTVSCDRRLAPLLARSLEGIKLLPGKPGHDDWKQGANLEVDYQSPTGNVPRYLRVEREDFPDRKGFLVAGPARIEHWRKRLGTLGSGLKVGISWQGGQDLLTLRKAPWELWREIFSIDGLQFVNLQPGNWSSVLQNLERQWGVRVHTFSDADPMRNLDESAALMSALDVVLTVPNANVHLAGALGLPVWVLFTPAFGCWWIVKDVDSPWYPTARIFTKPKSARWHSVVDPLIKAFAELRGSQPVQDDSGR